MLSHTSTIATAELAFYAIGLAIAVALAMRNGWRNEPYWAILAAFAFARILGAAMQLGTITAPLNLHLYRGAATLAQMGLALLLLASLGLMVAVRTSVHRRRQTLIRPYIIYLQGLLLGATFVLGIVAAASVPDSDFAGFTTTPVPPTLVASTILSMITFLILSFCTVCLWLDAQCFDQTAKWLLSAATASLPFLLVRIVYSALCTFVDNMEFHWFKGCPLMLIVMSMLMEFAVVVIYESVGILTARRVVLNTANASPTGARISDISKQDDSSCSSGTPLRNG
ncbi:hypothetical protein P170DRAFT_509341 [Aspergillus steynii IBT 23096]|uniref:DUF7702 domain-containing protein n=1 Tax=Aspergillus steynii IBT 23096 TaxID=1392250 RepID=A0A2I2GEP3_9EURO|nr:uncharacterized protein P170DRAFT_509341 [Aspergillus steynii IBT 23096]PLB51353.1 hypothetical protein P170DRAFT_509341 [Aspergillus steynii IBT 23096]